ncbi:metal ABC transporter solute-binding protein, Zn/Mn family [Furfurilactobacillus entadae]|uniref:metal ABC transporter solute-binding protein, Zn/Mn family n=1 Tax=Furfurilactobacillus entadae TaxID=2922307 RepID=UPI0035EF65A7
MKQLRIGFIITLLTASLMGGLMMGHVQSAHARSRSITVVSSLDVYAEAAQAVLGHAGTATAIINSPSIDAEDYEPTTATAKQVAKADVVIANGVGYDDWLTRVATANNKQRQTITVGDQLLSRKAGDNPHVWYHKKTMPLVVKQLVSRFSRLQPQRKRQFQQNATRYLATLTPWHQLTQQIRKTSQNQRVAVSEPVANDMLTAAGLKVTNDHFARSVEEGTDPSPADIAKLTADFKHHRVVMWVENTQNSQTIVDNMTKTARRYHVPVVKVTETLPRGKTYAQWMTAELTQVQAALKEAKEDDR